MSDTPGGPPEGSPEAIEADIDRQRDELADTVDALRSRLDVKARAAQGLHDLQDRATTRSGRPRPELLGPAAAAVLLVAGLWWWRRRAS